MTHHGTDYILTNQPANSSCCRTPFGRNNQRSYIYARVFVIATVVLLGFLFYKIILPFIAPLIWALFLAFLLHPPHRYLTRKLKGRKNLSAALITISTFIIIIGPIMAMNASFITQVAELVKWIQEILAKQYSQQYHMLADLPLIGSILERMNDSFGIHTSQMQDWFAQGSQRLPDFFASMGGKIFMGLINTAFAFVIMLFMFFFFLRDGAESIEIFHDMIPMTPVHRDNLMAHMAAVTRSVVFGTGVTSLIQGTLIGIAFLISSRGEVGTLAVFIGVLGGAAAFGPIGFFLGPIVLALIIALMRFALEIRYTH